jgi:hypothetical protein
MGDGDSKIDAEKCTGDPQSDAQATCVQTTHGHLPAGYTLNAGEVDETAAVPIQIIVLLTPDPISATHTPESSGHSDGLEQPQEMANASADDPITVLQRQLEALRRQLEEQQSAQRLWNASSEEMHKERSASLAERVGKLELSAKRRTSSFHSGRMHSMSKRRETSRRLSGIETDPDATVGGADIAVPEQTCELAESMWDVALFLGRPDVGMGHVNTLWAVLVLLLNMLLQTSVAVIVLLSMSDPIFEARVIEDLWCASEPRFAFECHVLCPGWVIISSTRCGSRCCRWHYRQSCVGYA